MLESWHEQNDTEIKNNWEIARWQTFRTVCPPKPKGGMLAQKDFAVFPWEKQNIEINGGNKTEHSTRERFDKLNKMWQ